MDVEWSLSQLNHYLWLHERVPLPPEKVTTHRKSAMRGSVEERANINHVVRAIAQATYREPQRWLGADSVRQLIWELTEGDEVRERLGLDEPPPMIEADAMHPWVWDAARPHWTSGNHDAALWAAGINVTSRTQRKLDRHDIGEGQLIREAFSTDDPVPGRPRLRLCDRTNPMLFKDRHVGASSLGQGLYSAIRNTLNHVDSEQHQIGDLEAIEALAAFSLLARWIDGAQVDRAPVAD
ncbi:TIGR02391 family protein [Cellulomonas sp. P5_C5]